MNRLRRLSRLHLLVLLCQLLVLATATASPWVDPRPLGPMCGALGAGTAGDSSDTLDCPACLPLQAPPPAAFTPFTAAAGPAGLGAAAPSFLLDLQRLPIPPARGPPTV
jgi:hypothetical protein